VGATAATQERLPELASVYWRPRASEASLRRDERRWTLVTVAHTIPFVGVAVLLAIAKPVTIPVGLILIAHAWIVPELYAARGANVLRRGQRARGETESERVALGLLGDLVDHDPRALLARTGVVLERGALGTWIVGSEGAVLVRPGGRRVHCYCVRATGSALPRGDRVAHLLLALRADETGFATVANLAFAGARWRLRRRLRGPGLAETREALDRA
jgi:hypothetical protein